MVAPHPYKAVICGVSAKDDYEQHVYLQFHVWH